MDLLVKRLPHAFSIPIRGTPRSAGLDLHSAENADIEPRGTVMIKTGLQFALPEGTVGLITIRSGLAKKGLSILNSPGIIDEDFRGENTLLFFNHTKYTTHRINRGDRVAQIVIVPSCFCDVIEAETLLETDRGEGGWGSTGR